MSVVGMTSNIHFSNNDFYTLAGKPSVELWKLDSRTRKTRKSKLFSLCTTMASKNALSVWSNFHILALVYRMVVMNDRKIKDAAKTFRLQKNHKHQAAQKRFLERNSLTVSKFSLTIFSAFTNSENLKLFFLA